ncbi:hypothetical protein LLH06_15420 [Mucilaginibacter daejeonensis]|uniref:hypothetical protein n=1 Tax=Mucilaginibacter daejeonensis TaxID=398049 RepID=UPI001D17AE54|nr:hypothetical protein [Mucilaginibacter daejeonensis]UEG52346.1 hypothetical protein LLH06_15420 [Mucilaginibacter daejeonensis]
MSFKTILAILITIVLTVFIIQNQDEATFHVLFGTMTTSKMTALIGVALGGFILGVIVATPGRKKYEEREEEYDEEEEEDDAPRRRPDTLSDEDRDYIS